MPPLPQLPADGQSSADRPQDVRYVQQVLAEIKASQEARQAAVRLTGEQLAAIEATGCGSKTHRSHATVPGFARSHFDGGGDRVGAGKPWRARYELRPGSAYL